ncbi:uncharacterized protein PHACADRAFT_159766 [Phanerochaete carnosa HHB-10118-sp]|uniref:Uncharacterized protein n=1 Tax=Phanerochaete carnosa (strain HHB-10118-sp) TaxID=650164 RepID=K5WHS3_PHACS|nr:uncharacterized protein PHACADRAFT_159766 [Phanerochaete carnosa HHB-10118-sp]EKM58669.1 hypothetical protein PHACADRAFT_159766 [Phanerochaete carnosa HHB-10118-sp]
MPAHDCANPTLTPTDDPLIAETTVVDERSALASRLVDVHSICQPPIMSRPPSGSAGLSLAHSNILVWNTKKKRLNRLQKLPQARRRNLRQSRHLRR